VNLHKTLDDALGPLTPYNNHLLHLDESRELQILNGLLCFLDCNNFKCVPHSGGNNVVDHVLANKHLLPYIHHSSITSIPLVDHYRLSFSLKPNQLNPRVLVSLPPHQIALSPCHITLLFNDIDPNDFTSPPLTTSSFPLPFRIPQGNLH